MRGFAIIRIVKNTGETQLMKKRAVMKPVTGALTPRHRLAVLKHRPRFVRSSRCYIINMYRSNAESEAIS